MAPARSFRASLGISKALLCLAWIGATACGPQPAPAQRAIARPVAPMRVTVAAGDVFEVRVYRHADLSSTYTVADDGTIDFPLLGRLDVNGMTSSEIAERIASGLKQGELLLDPQVSVNLTTVASRHVTVVGAIARPGQYPVAQRLSVLQAVGLAGGFTSLADKNETRVIRHTDNGVRPIRVRVEAIMTGQATDFQLEPGDVVNVPERSW